MNNLTPMQWFIPLGASGLLGEEFYKGDNTESISDKH